MCVCLSRIRGRRSNICCATASFLPSVRPNVRLSFLANFRVLFPALFVYLHTQAAYAVHPTPYTLHHRLPCKIAQIIIIIIKEGNSRVSREAERIRKRRQIGTKYWKRVVHTHTHSTHTNTQQRERKASNAWKMRKGIANSSARGDGLMKIMKKIHKLKIQTFFLCASFRK